MSNRKIYDDKKHIHFVTFSCYKRQKYLQHERASRIVIENLGSRLAKHNGRCLGFVIMPDHVHALIWFPESGQLSPFMNKWKDQSSQALKDLYRVEFPSYWATIDVAEPVWQRRYYDYNVWTRQKVEEKLDYMHLNPVRAGLVDGAVDWPWSSARWYLKEKSVGLPISWPPGLETDDACNAG
jgi:putative transposase